MGGKCPHCGKAPYPLWEGEAWKSKVLWKNLFKIDLMAVLFMVAIVLMVVGYRSDIAKCDEVIEQPCQFCNRSNCCKVLQEIEMQKYSDSDAGFSAEQLRELINASVE